MVKTMRTGRVLVMTAVLGLSVPMTACSQSSARGNQRWQSVCLDRLLVDLPAPVEVGAGNVVYQGGYNFPGVTSIGATGIKWNGVMLDETHVTDAQGLEAFRVVVRQRLGSEKAYRSDIGRRESNINRWTKRLTDDNVSSEEKADTKQRIDRTQVEIRELYRFQKVSGFAKIDASDAFAMRDNDEFKIGYLDPTDRRVRYFEGPLSPAEIALDSPEAAAREFARFGRIYHRRDITEIPTAPGYCTAHGFIDEPANYTPQDGDTLNLPFRSLKYPNLVFILIIERAYAEAPRDAMQQDNPNVITLKDIQNLKGMAALGALANLGQIKRKYGPKRIEMAGQSGGRIYGREYHHKDYLEEGGPGAAYELEAEVMGEPGRADRPHIKLQMAAALADAPRLPKGQEAIRPALKGQVPPSFEEGLKIFEEVVRSVRVRPVTTAPASQAH